MKPEILYIFPNGSFGDKNTNVQLITFNEEHLDFITSFHCEITQYYMTARPEIKKFKDLNLFRQGFTEITEHNSEGWIMLESWSDKEDLFFEFVTYLSEQLKLKIEII